MGEEPMEDGANRSDAEARAADVVKARVEGTEPSDEKTKALAALDRAFMLGEFRELRRLSELANDVDVRAHGAKLVARTRPRREESALLVVAALLLLGLAWHAYHP